MGSRQPTAPTGRAPVTWLVIADGEQARILERRGTGRSLNSVLSEDLVAPNLADHELGCDRPGSGRDRMGYAFHAKEPRTSPHRHEKQVFARRVAKLVNQAAGEGRFDRLVVVAPAGAMGDLRQALDAHAQTLLVAEVVKDLTHHPDHRILEHLDETLI